MKKFLTLDVGTTAVKASLFDEKLQMLGLEIREYQLDTPQTDFVELPAHIYWDKAVDGIHALLEHTKADPADIVSITCTTQGETLIPVDQKGEPLFPAIVWLDARAKTQSDALASLFSKEAFYRHTGIPEMTPYCPVAKVLWLKQEQPEIYEKTTAFLLLEDYLLYRLTGKQATNRSLICTTGYYDICANAMWDEMLQKAGLDQEKFPPVLPCGEKLGTLTADAAAETGLSVSTVAVTGAMDQVASAIGAGNVVSGILSETTGTCLAVGATVGAGATDQWSPIPVYTHALPDCYFKLTVMQTAGMALKWFRNEFCKDLMAEGGNAYGRMDDLAEAEPPLSRGLIMFPYLTGMDTDPAARGVFFGAGLDTNRGCFIRAIMEAVAYSLRESMDQMGGAYQEIHSVGGGSKSNVWNQIKADTCGIPVQIMQQEEATSVGAAILGGIAVGCFRDIHQACGLLKVGNRYESTDAHDLYKEGYRKYQAMYDSFKDLFHMPMHS